MKQLQYFGHPGQQPALKSETETLCSSFKLLVRIQSSSCIKKLNANTDCNFDYSTKTSLLFTQKFSLLMQIYVTGHNQTQIIKVNLNIWGRN